MGTALDSNARIIFCNLEFLKSTGWTEEEVIGEDWFEMFIPDHAREAARKTFHTPLGQNTPFEFSAYENEILTRQGNLLNVAWSNLISRDPAGNLLNVSSLGIDLTEKYRTEAALRTSQETFLTVLNSIDATVYVADMDTYEILFMNQHMIESFGRDLTGEICWDVFRGEKGPCAHCTNADLVDEFGTPTGVCVWDDKNPITGKWYNNYDRAITWTDEKVVKLQIATDITDLKEASRIIEKMSVTDELTQIYNRRYFHERLEQETQRAVRYNTQLSLVFMDIDRFKLVNDFHGHQAGDSILVGIADQIRLNVRKADVVARYGGEEFVVILPETESEGAMRFAEKLRVNIESRTFDIDNGRALSVTASFGVTSLKNDSGSINELCAELIRSADMALYASKKNGRNKVTVF
ncbi:MAG: diguanylate cyclase [Desulfobacterales bacterium]|nr:diguanylate cyclase [Desulfobacterales bacterium]